MEDVDNNKCVMDDAIIYKVAVARLSSTAVLISDSDVIEYLYHL